MFNDGVILCYNSMNRYKVSFNPRKQVIELYHLDNNTLWECFDYFECDENMSGDEIINESKQLINVWKGESKTDIHHITELN